MSIEWSYPNNGAGSVRGLHDAGIETFSGKEIKSLAREICQNSLDANSGDGNPVIVKFLMKNINTKNIPGINQYKDILDKCGKYWDDNDKALAFLDNASACLKKTATSVLCISDYNTTGLSHPYDASSREGWNTLTKIDGGSNKGKNQDGNFGIGKNAPFTNSAFRMVFYRTLNKDNEQAAQGVSRLVSFPENLDDVANTLTTGLGFYGDTNGKMPVKSIHELDELVTRDKTGTDVFIYGFQHRSSEDSWRNEVAVEIIKNYVVSIFKNKLEVFIQGEPYTNQYLKEKMGNMKSKAKDSYNCYRLLTASEDKVNVFSLPFHDLGTFKLSVLYNSTDTSLNQKVMICRPSGMKLFMLKDAPALNCYTALLEMEGPDLAEYFGKMENPAHTAWQANRHNDREQAKEYLDEVYTWVRESILSLYVGGKTESMDVMGLGAALQASNDTDGDSSASGKNGLEDMESTVEINFTPAAKTSKGFVIPYAREGTPRKNGSKPTREPGTISGNGTNPTMRGLSGTPRPTPRKRRERHKGEVASGGKDIVHVSPKTGTPIPLEGVRIFPKGDSFRLSFKIPQSIKRGYIEIKASGENGKDAKMKVVSADIESACDMVQVTDGNIYFVGMKESERVSLNIKFAATRLYGMGVYVYEDK